MLRGSLEQYRKQESMSGYKFYFSLFLGHTAIFSHFYFFKMIFILSIIAGLPKLSFFKQVSLSNGNIFMPNFVSLIICILGGKLPYFCY